MTFKGQVEEQRGSQGITKTWPRGCWETAHTSHFQLGSSSVRLGRGQGQESAETPQAFGADWCLPFGVFLCPVRGREKTTKRREREHLPHAVCQDPTLKGSPSSLPLPLPFLQKVPGSSRRDPQETPGAYLPAQGPLQHCWCDGST